MRRLPVFVLAFVLGFSSLGCDSSEDDPSDAELFVGTWALVSIRDGGGDKTPLLLAAANSMVAVLNSNNTFEVDIDYKEQPDLHLEGTHVVNEGAKQLVLTVGPQNPPFTYSFASDTRTTISANSQIVNGLFATTLYTGNVVMTIQKQ
ncbi:MAG: hypothetical protein WED81_06180 [Rhodothermales bacterium]